MPTIPVIDIAPLLSGRNPEDTAAAIGAACREHGFFYITGHGIDPALQHRLQAFSREFFALPEAQKMKIAMKYGGRAWRGYFPVGGELTSGRPDRKEGLYFGEELENDHPKVLAGTPMHGRNLFPQVPVGFDAVVLDYMKAITGLGHRLMEAFSLALGLDASFFRTHFTADPLTLFRIFHYPPQRSDENDWGVGEHTDYGLLTILKQDDAGGLQVWSNGGWIDAPPVEGAFVVNIGDMLEKMTGGLFRSTPHRVRNVSGKERYSFPFFFDPGWDVAIHPVAASSPTNGGPVRKRWDGADIHDYTGTYGEYILSKVAKVFPDLADRQARDRDEHPC